jgi:hypothetical protein
LVGGEIRQNRVESPMRARFFRVFVVLARDLPFVPVTRFRKRIFGSFVGFWAKPARGTTLGKHSFAGLRSSKAT